MLAPLRASPRLANAVAPWASASAVSDKPKNRLFPPLDEPQPNPSGDSEDGGGLGWLMMVHPPDGLLNLVGLLVQGQQQQQNSGAWAGRKMLRVAVTATAPGSVTVTIPVMVSVSVSVTTVTITPRVRVTAAHVLSSLSSAKLFSQKVGRKCQMKSSIRCSAVRCGAMRAAQPSNDVAAQNRLF